MTGPRPQPAPNGFRIPVTVWLPPELYRVLAKAAAMHRTDVGPMVAEAARRGVAGDPVVVSRPREPRRPAEQHTGSTRRAKPRPAGVSLWQHLDALAAAERVAEREQQPAP